MHDKLADSIADSVALSHRDRTNGPVRRAIDYLLQRQRKDGSFAGRIGNDNRAAAFYFIALRVLCISPSESDLEMIATLRATQLACGGWPAIPGGEPDDDVTLLCALALEDLGHPLAVSAFADARAWILRDGVRPHRDGFWQFFGALFGVIGWHELPYCSPRLVAPLRWQRPTIHDFSFIRLAIVAVAILQAYEPALESVRKSKLLTEHWDRSSKCAARIRRTANPDGRVKRGWMGSAFWLAANRVSRLIDHIFPPRREPALAIEWLLAHQEPNGSFFSATQMTALAIVTLALVDRQKYDQEIGKGLDAIRSWQVSDAGGRWQQFTDSTTWDTAWALLTICEDKPDNRDRWAARAAKWLAGHQTDHIGDWAYRMKHPQPGGWCFQQSGICYPDCDDTAQAVRALLTVDAAGYREEIEKGVRWLLAMQNRDGGWASWDRDDRCWLRIPGGGPWIAPDPSTADITAHVLDALVAARSVELVAALHPAIDRSVARARRWLEQTQSSGRWFGAWLTHYIYGTCEVVGALRRSGTSPDAPAIGRAIGWLVSVANSDGGFGESPRSVSAGGFVTAPSTAFHTALALRAMVRAGWSESPTAAKAAGWLIRRQRAPGSWQDDCYFAAGIPGLWYASYELFPTIIAADALRLYHKALCTELKPTDTV